MEQCANTKEAMAILGIKSQTTIGKKIRKERKAESISTS